MLACFCSVPQVALGVAAIVLVHFLLLEPEGWAKGAAAFVLVPATVLVPCVALLFCNREITRLLLLGTFEAPFLLLLNTVSCVGWALLFQGDATRMLVVAYQYTATTLVIFIDAFPKVLRSHRRIFILLVLFLEIMAFEIVGTYLNLFPDVHDEVWHPVEGSAIRMSYTVVTGRLITLSLFFTKNARRKKFYALLRNTC